MCVNEEVECGELCVSCKTRSVCMILLVTLWAVVVHNMYERPQWTREVVSVMEGRGV